MEESEAIRTRMREDQAGPNGELRKLNEQARREAEQPWPSAGARLRERKNKNAKPGNPPKGRDASNEQARKKETAGRNEKELDELVNMVFELQKQVYRPPS